MERQHQAPRIIRFQKNKNGVGKIPTSYNKLNLFTIMTQNEEIRNTLARVVSVCTVHLPDGTQTITDKEKKEIEEELRRAQEDEYPIN